MLAAYTWGQFFIFLAISLFIYYVYVLFFYYGNEINKAIAGKKQKPVSTPAAAQYTHTAPPIIAESINHEDVEEEEESINELSTDTSDIQDADILTMDTYDWENTKAFTMDYRDATEEEEILLENIDVAVPDSNEILEGGIPAEDYVEATTEIQKEKIEEEKKETTKSVLRRAYFNTSYVELYNMNKNAKSHIDALLTNLAEEGKIPSGEIAVHSDFVAKASGNEDIQALLDTLNHQ